MKIKEGGVMDIEEKKAFEIAFDNKLGARGCQFDLDEDGNYEDRETLCGWHMWLEAKAQAVPEKTVKLHLVWNENKDECVGFLDSNDARYTATGDDRGMFGVTALGDYFRDLNDERDEFETEVVMIEAQEPTND